MSDNSSEWYTVSIPGAFASYLAGTGDLQDAPDADAVALRKSWEQAPVLRAGRSYTVVLTADADQMWLVAGHAQFMAGMSPREGEFTAAEVRGARKVLSQLPDFLKS